MLNFVSSFRLYFPIKGKNIRQWHASIDGRGVGMLYWQMRCNHWWRQVYLIAEFGGSIKGSRRTDRRSEGDWLVLHEKRRIATALVNRQQIVSAAHCRFKTETQEIGRRRGIGFKGGKPCITLGVSAATVHQCQETFAMFALATHKGSADPFVH